MRLKQRLLLFTRRTKQAHLRIALLLWDAARNSFGDSLGRLTGASAYTTFRSKWTTSLLSLMTICLITLMPCLSVQAEGTDIASAVLPQEATSAFNQGMTLLRSNHNEEAAAKFQYVTELVASHAQAYYELGIALMKLGKFDQAIAEFNHAIRFQPGMSADWLALGSAYQLAGQSNEAIATYKEFIGRFPHDENVSRVRKLISSLSKNQTVEFDNGDQEIVQGDYLTDMTRQGAFPWPAQHMPIKVWIEKGDLIPGYRPVFTTILKNAFLAWADASGGLVSIVFVTDPAMAEMECRWTDNTLKFQNSTESGETRLYSDRLGVAKGEMEILTMPAPGVALTDKHMQRVALHEVGHALGLAGHTKNQADTMFYSTATNIDIWKTLSQRDKNTIVRLYTIRR